MDLSETISVVMRKAASEAGDRLMSLFGSGLSASDKSSHKDIVTRADTESQLIIQSTIRRRLLGLGYDEEEIGFIGEEKLKVEGKYIFIIDPLDGTTNFAAGFPFFCVSIACVKDGKIFSGLVYDPIRKTFYSAQVGKGAFIANGESKPNPFNPAAETKTMLKIKPQPLKTSIIAGHFNGGEQEWMAEFKAYEKLYPEVRALRNPGSLALDMVMLTQNVLNCVISGSSYIWDIAAATLIIEESGGVVTDWEGKPLKFDFEKNDIPYRTIACDRSLLPEMLKVFN